MLLFSRFGFGANSRASTTPKVRVSLNLNRRTLSVLTLLVGLFCLPSGYSSTAIVFSIDQCPRLQGIYQCSHEGSFQLRLQESRTVRWVTYYFSVYPRDGEDREWQWVANDQGRRQYEDWSLIGVCKNQRFWVSPYGEVTPDTEIYALSPEGDLQIFKGTATLPLWTCERR